MVDPKRLDELCQSWPVHGMQWPLPTGKWNTNVVEIIDSSTASGTDETTLVLRFELASDDTGGQQDRLQRHLTLTFADFKYIRDIPTAMRYAEGLHSAVLDFLQSDMATESRRIRFPSISLQDPIGTHWRLTREFVTGKPENGEF